MLRAVALLKALVASDGALDLSDLASAVSLARSTTHRLLAALQSEGLVTRDDTGSYRLGPAAITLGVRALRSNDLRSVVRPYLSELAETSRETATFEVLSDRTMLILDEVPGSHLLAANPELGTAWALHATASGKCLLAALSDEDRGQLLSGPFKRFTPHTLTSRRRLEEDFERIRRRGYATAVEELEVGFVAAAAVVRDAGANPVGAVSVNAPALRLSGQKLARAGRRVAHVAKRASRALGCRG